jgi:hypothetical protein
LRRPKAKILIAIWYLPIKRKHNNSHNSGNSLSDAAFAAGDASESVGRAAARHCQMIALNLQPWMSPPRYADMRALDQPFGDPGGKRESAELALRMQRQGVSRWHPDPLAACEEAEQRRAAV